jgi:uncharacterized phage protein (TIGR02218 family)
MPISEQMETYLAGNVCWLSGFWRVEAKDGTVVAVTTCSRDLTFGGTVYWPMPVMPSQVESKDNGDPGSADMRGLLHAGIFTKLDLARGKWRGARVEYEVRNPRDLTLGYSEREVFYLGDVQTTGPMFQAEFDSLLVKINQPIGAVTQPKCRRELGDEFCTKDLAAFTHTTTITAVASNGEFTIAAPLAAEYLRNGTALWLTGNNLGAPRVRIKDHLAGGVVRLMLGMRANVAVGDQIEVIAGCDKTRTDCRDKFENMEFFDGEPDQPGNGELYKIPE